MRFAIFFWQFSVNTVCKLDHCSSLADFYLKWGLFVFFIARFSCYNFNLNFVLAIAPRIREPRFIPFSIGHSFWIRKANAIWQPFAFWFSVNHKVNKRFFLLCQQFSAKEPSKYVSLLNNYTLIPTQSFWDVCRTRILGWTTLQGNPTIRPASHPKRN